MPGTIGLAKFLGTRSPEEVTYTSFFMVSATRLVQATKSGSVGATGSIISATPISNNPLLILSTTVCTSASTGSPNVMEPIFIWSLRRAYVTGAPVPVAFGTLISVSRGCSSTLGGGGGGLLICHLSHT